MFILVLKFMKKTLCWLEQFWIEDSSHGLLWGRIQFCKDYQYLLVYKSMKTTLLKSLDFLGAVGRVEVIDKELAKSYKPGQEPVCYRAW